MMLKATAAEASDILHRFPAYDLLTLTPTGDWNILLSESELLSRDFAEHRLQRNLSLITVSGVCMSGAENIGRKICAAILCAGIRIFAVSLCDLALALVISTQDADRIFHLIETIEPLAL